MQLLTFGGFRLNPQAKCPVTQDGLSPLQTRLQLGATTRVWVLIRVPSVVDVVEVTVCEFRAFGVENPPARPKAKVRDGARRGIVVDGNLTETVAQDKVSAFSGSEPRQLWVCSAAFFHKNSYPMAKTVILWP